MALPCSVITLTLSLPSGSPVIMRLILDGTVVRVRGDRDIGRGFAMRAAAISYREQRFCFYRHDESFGFQRADHGRPAIRVSGGRHSMRNLTTHHCEHPNPDRKGAAKRGAARDIRAGKAAAGRDERAAGQRASPARRKYPSNGRARSGLRRS